MLVNTLCIYAMCVYVYKKIYQHISIHIPSIYVCVLAKIVNAY
jgi:hypothetical protein